MVFLKEKEEYKSQTNRKRAQRTTPVMKIQSQDSVQAN